jgi:hypothetical protein
LKQLVVKTEIKQEALPLQTIDSPLFTEMVPIFEQVPYVFYIPTMSRTYSEDK